MEVTFKHEDTIRTYECDYILCAMVEEIEKGKEYAQVIRLVSDNIELKNAFFATCEMMLSCNKEEQFLPRHIVDAINIILLSAKRHEWLASLPSDANGRNNGDSS